MSFFDDASLVMIPSGYKDQKVYSVKPIDGTGDLTFSRSNDTASRVNSSGLIEKVRTNLALYSQAFTNAVYVPTAGTFTDNYGTAPDGTQTACRWISTNTDPYIYQPIALNGTYTASVWVKGVVGYSGKDMSIRIGSDATYVPLTNEWQRVSVTGTYTATINCGMEAPEDAVIGDEVLIWGFQVELGDIATDYIATTSSAVSVGPVANLPRLDYSGGATCPSLLLEPQRTNLLSYSEQFNNAAWIKSVSSITANAAISPDGYQNADKLVADVGSAGHIAYRSIAATGTHTISIFAKAAGYNYLNLAYDGGSLDFGIIFNLSNGTISQNPAGLTGTIEAVGTNGWYRCTLTYNYPSTLFFVVAPHDNSGSYTWNGNGTDGVFIWGAQWEAGAYATSYIPTLGAASTRGADSASKTSASALIGQTEGTIYWETEFTTMVATGHEGILNIDDGAFGDTIYLFKGSTGGIVAEIYLAGLQQASFSTSAQPIGTYKMALAYANNNTAFFLNGVQIGTTDTSCSIPATTRIQLGNGGLGPSTDGTKQVLLFPTRLSNADLATLTTI